MMLIQSSGSSKLVLGSLASVLLTAQIAADSSDWHWQASIYGWLPDIEGSTRFPAGVEGPSLEVSAEQLIDNLSMTFMANINTRKELWGIHSDLIYLHEAGSRTAFREFALGPNQSLGSIELDARLDIKAWVWTLAGTHRVNSSENTPVEVLFGTRMLDIDQKFVWSITGEIGETDLIGPSGTIRASATNWDAILGVKGQILFGQDHRWVLPWYVDVGAGGSDFTWQAGTGLGYRFDWGSLALNYRYLDYDLGSGEGVNDMNFAGPMAAATFCW